ncbi:hypothetical protein CBR_g52346 [Chara braunii]|uniref:BED-type domain-containing protein n=1 Tax=Chara braunii TaxID=69332 RepID=A0A388K6S5_CHABU|nr:hypothetical protein CBR_g52346 [Chara braunii]|eukprot:GBG65754.1 hypothetical protein CBR_g52346 [Chara braunii]
MESSSHEGFNSSDNSDMSDPKRKVALKSQDKSTGTAGSSAKTSDMKNLKLAIHTALKKGELNPPYILKDELENIFDVWKSFARVCFPNGAPVREHCSGYVACRQCLRVYAFTPSHGTSILRQHTCRKEPETADLMRLLATSAELTATQKNRMAKKVVMWCCKDLRPFTVAEDQGLLEVLQEAYDMGVAVDSGSNMAAIEGIRKIYKWIVCADHKIATVLTTVFNKTSTTTGGVRSSPFYRYHEFAPHLFEMIDNSKTLVRFFKQGNLQNSLSKTLRQENVTQWNSLLILLNSILDSYDEVITMLSRLANTNQQANKQFLVTRIDKTSLVDLVWFLRRFQTATLKLEQYLEPTIHLVAFERSVLLEYCEPRNEPYNGEDAEGNNFTISSDSDDIAVIKMLMKDVLREKWILEDLHIAATLLDPWQKERLDRFGLSEAEVEQGKNCLQEFMYNVKDSSVEPSEEHVAAEGKRPTKRRKKAPEKEIPDELTLCSTDEDEEKDLPIARTGPLTLPQRIKKELS